MEYSKKYCTFAFWKIKTNKDTLMKKIALFALAALTLASCKNNSAKTETANVDSLAQVETVYDIAFVDMDILVTGYDMYIEKKAELDKKAEQIDKNLTTRGRKLEKEIMDLTSKTLK